jgi:alkanesulfonate monooxygenase SsuD/methylene tetrahydromethanopterin reductase-like flavin-dependent oxidoreductase (luciferase family)
VTRFGEAIEMIAGMLRDERTTTKGTWFRATNLPAQPRPVQDRLPILVGTASPRMARLTAQWADEWNTWGDPGEVERRLNVFTEACTRVGRDPATLHKSAQAMIVLTDDAARAEQMRAALPADRPIVGQPGSSTSSAATPSSGSTSSSSRLHLRELRDRRAEPFAGSGRRRHRRSDGSPPWNLA